MIEVKFSDEQIKLIKSLTTSTELVATLWSSENFISIRKFIKDHYLQQQDYTCCFCKQKIKVSHNRAWDTEHLISRSSYPSFMFEPKNLCVTCIECNTEKTDLSILTATKKISRFPKKSNQYKIAHPHFDIYEDHIEVIVAGQFYRFKSQKGKFTIRAYGLDRFLDIANRPKEINYSPKIAQLWEAALTADSNYESIETQLLEELILKHSEKLGSRESLDAIKKLRTPTSKPAP